LSPAVFGSAIVCFFFPFVTGGCEHRVTLTGMQLATGQGMTAQERAIFVTEGPIPYVPVLIALTMCVVGVCLAILWVRSAIAASAIAGTVGVLALVAALPSESDPFNRLTRGLHRGYAIAFVLLTVAAIFDAGLGMSASGPRVGEAGGDRAGATLPSNVALWFGLAAVGLLPVDPTRIASAILSPVAVVAGLIGVRRNPPGERRAVAGYAMGIAAGFIALVYMAAPG
jgi:hypothetical protein